VEFHLVADCGGEDQARHERQDKGKKERSKDRYVAGGTMMKAQ
jgi:hypothetical protein